jgi:hypothetical protein
MCCVASAMGAASTAILQVLILEGRFDMGSPKIDAKLIAGIVILVREGPELASSIQSNPIIIPDTCNNAIQLLNLLYWNEPTN